MKDFKNIKDLLSSTMHNKYAFVDYLLEYVEGNYHCLDSLARSVIIQNKGWSLKYKHLFALLILKNIESNVIDVRSDVTDFLNSFVFDFSKELYKEMHQLGNDGDVDISVFGCDLPKLLKDNSGTNLSKSQISSKNTNNHSQRNVKTNKEKEPSAKVLGISYWGKLTVNSSVGEITKLIDAKEKIPINIKSSCLSNSDDTSNENVLVRVDIYKGNDRKKLDIISSVEKTLLVELHAADYLLSPFKQTCVRVTANVIFSIDANRQVKEDISWDAERFRYTRDWVDTITPSNDEPFDYTNGLGGLVGG